jgi:hypothetical protein
MCGESERDRSAAFRLQNFRILNAPEQAGRLITSHISAA